MPVNIHSVSSVSFGADVSLHSCDFSLAPRKICQAQIHRLRAVIYTSASRWKLLQDQDGVCSLLAPPQATTPFSQMQCDGDSGLGPLQAAALLCPVPLPMGLSIQFSARHIYWNSKETKDPLNALSDVKYILHDPAQKVYAIGLEEVTAKYFRGIKFIDWDEFPSSCWNYSQ